MKIVRKILSYLATRNGIRIVSLLAAIAIWYVVRAVTGNATIVTDIRLEIQPPADWLVVDQSTHAVDVSFLGTRDDVRYLNRELIKASIDLRHHTNSDAFTHTLTAADINAPGSSRIDFIRPSTVTLRLDREITKQIPVVANTQNLLPDGYEMERVVVTPATVELIGPEKRLSSIESIQTAIIDLDGRTRSINKRRVALLTGDHMDGVRLQPPIVTVDVHIAERTLSSRFPDIPVRALLPANQSLQVDLSPTTVILTVKGRPELMKNLDPEELLLFVDVGDIESSKPVKRAVRADLPPGITLVRTEPARLTVHVKD